MSTSYGSLQRLASTTDRVNRVDRPVDTSADYDSIEIDEEESRSAAEGRDIELMSRLNPERIELRTEPRDQDAGPWQQGRLNEPTEST
jgi:hypothetical protein